MSKTRCVICVVLVVTTGAGCIPETMRAPTAGYGDPYKGDGKPIYVKDSRTDWTIAQGGKPITSEHALEVTNDAEYLARREIAKEHNDKLYEDGKSHATRGRIFEFTGGGILLAGLAIGLAGPTLLRDSSSGNASATAPESHELKGGAASNGALLGGIVLALVGAGLIYYGYRGGSEPPPYIVWHTPGPLNRPAYVREKTEAYNEKVGAPAVEDQPGSVESVALAPGQRKPPPPRPTNAKKTGAGK